MGSYHSCVMVQGALQAAMVTMINKFVGGLIEKEDGLVEDGDDILADFKANSKSGSTENLIREVVQILTFLTDRLETVASSGHGKQALPVLLESVNTILEKVPVAIKHNPGFQELLWKRLCPCLIVLLGEPKAEKIANQKTGRPEVAKTGGSSTSSPHITHAAAKVIYNIAGELASLVGEIPALRPVLESLFHKMLMFPLPQNRHDALRVVKELMSEPQKVISLIGSSGAAGEKARGQTNLALIKLLVDSVQQCSHCADPGILYSSVCCVDSLLASLDRIRQGEAIPDSWLKQDKSSKSQGSLRRSMTSN
ncbi:brefeldin A-inhibited guanine nucleotide-exchange protein 3, partial [Aplysia californica]|uniref:Brefeldin A-inhibited guanine nucleotide-exchange protein 3 n=1 Tax=Aplysia californica TaxID=6500 RepID=A0ABM0ZYM9_APLCA